MRCMCPPWTKWTEDETAAASHPGRRRGNESRGRGGLRGKGARANSHGRRRGNAPPGDKRQATPPGLPRGSSHVIGAVGRGRSVVPEWRPGSRGDGGARRSAGRRFDRKYFLHRENRVNRAPGGI